MDRVKIFVVDTAFDDGFVLILKGVCEFGLAESNRLLTFDSGYRTINHRR